MMGGRHRTGVHGEDHGFGGPWAVAMIVMMAALIGAIALAAFLLTRRHDGPQARPPSALSR
jgi:hypothetical protein